VLWCLFKPLGEWVPGSTPDNPPWIVHQGLARTAVVVFLHLRRRRWWWWCFCLWDYEKPIELD